MAEKIVVPVEIGGPEAVRSVRALTGEVDKLEKGVDKLSDKAGRADDALEEMGNRGGVSLRGLGEAFATTTGAVVAFSAAAVAAGVALGTAAGRGEDNLRAINALGSAYDEVRRATSDTVTAQQAFATQQRLVRSGLQVSTTQLGVITRAARDYARATGTDATQATEQLADALVGASADELQKYGVALRSGLERTEAVTQAIRQLAAQQEGAAPAARTLTEDMTRLGTSATEAASAFALLAADGLGLQSVVSGISDRLRNMTENLQGAINASRQGAEAQRRANAMEAITTARTQAQRALRARGLSEQEVRRRLPASLTPAEMNLIPIEQLEAAGRRTSTLPGTARRQEALAQSAAARRRASASVPLSIREAVEAQDRETRALVADVHGTMREAMEEATEATIAHVSTSTATLRQQLAAARAAEAARNRPPPRAPSSSSATPATAAELRAARAQSALLDLEMAQFGRSESIDQRDPARAEMQRLFAENVRGQRLAAARTEMEDTQRRRTENEAQRITRVNTARREYLTILREQREAEHAGAAATREAAAADKDREEALRSQLVAAQDAVRQLRDEGMQRTFNQLLSQTESTGEGGVLSGIVPEVASDERLTVMSAQADAMRSLAQETRNRITLLEMEGAAERDIAPLRERAAQLDLQAAQRTRDVATAERERAAAMYAYRDAMVSSLGDVTGAFVESAAAALDSEETFSRAIQKQFRQILVNLAKQGAVEALKNTALGVAALANPATAGAAPLYFKAAGLWAATGLAAGFGAAAIPKVEEAKGAGSARAPAPARAREGSAAGESSGPLVLNINVSGALMNEGVEESIVRALDRAATRGVSPRVLRAGRGM